MMIISWSPPQIISYLLSNSSTFPWSTVKKNHALAQNNWAQVQNIVRESTIISYQQKILFLLQDCTWSNVLFSSLSCPQLAFPLPHQQETSCRPKSKSRDRPDNNPHFAPSNGSNIWHCVAITRANKMWRTQQSAIKEGWYGRWPHSRPQACADPAPARQ